MKKNWFMTQNDQIIDLNDFNMFSIEKKTKTLFHVLAQKNYDFMLEIAHFDQIEHAKEYLEMIYSQLKDQEPKGIEEIMPMEVPPGYFHVR